MPRKGYRKPDADARRLVLRIYLTPDERAHIEACVQRSGGLTMGDFVRRLIMNYRIPSARHADQAELVRQLQKVGTNLNQLARAANSGHTIEPTGLQATIDELRGLLRRETIGR